MNGNPHIFQGVAETGLKSAIKHYPELYDKPHNGKSPDPVILTCVTSYIKGRCASGHQFAKALVCGREWCKVCGMEKSVIHERRMARWWSKAMNFESMGYLVITVPEQLRGSFKSKKILSEFRTYVKRKLQRMGYNKGLIRYHWAGDCTRCNGKGCSKCEGTGAGREFKPHLNVVIEQGYIPKELFNKKFSILRKDLSVWFKKKFPKACAGYEITGNCFLSYAKSDSHKIHKLKYITRATWRFYNKEICDLIKGFRTSSTWGKFEKIPGKKSMEDLISFENGLCPCCGEAIEWKAEFIRPEGFRKLNYEHVAGGYYILNSS